MALRVAFICSAGASPMQELALARPDIDYFVLTDRACGAENRCKTLGIPCRRIDAQDNGDLSQQVDRELVRFQPTIVLLLFSRLLVGDVIANHTFLNIHPALLPAFRGMRALEQARVSGVRYFGATLHGITEGIDDGPILAQACQALPPDASLSWMEKQSFLHKTALALLSVDMIESSTLRLHGNGPRFEFNPGSSYGNLNPGFANHRHLEILIKIQAREGVFFL